jgi:hypothetical protein
MEIMNHRFIVYVEGSLEETPLGPVLHVDHEVDMTPEQITEFMKVGAPIKEALKHGDID